MNQMYNKTENKVMKVPKVINANGANRYTSKMSIEKLNSLGWYEVEKGIKPDAKFYTNKEQAELIDNIYVIEYKAIEKSVEDLQNTLKSKISNKYKKEMIRPLVDTGLGYFIDGGRDDLESFKIGKKRGFTFIKDANGINHNADTNTYDTCIKTIEDKGIELMQSKWADEASVDDLTIFDELVDAITQI